MKKTKTEYFGVKISTYQIDDSIKRNKAKFDEWVKECVAEYSSSVDDYDSMEINSESPKIQHPNKSNHIHTSGGQLVGMYFVKAVKEHPPLKIYDTRPPNFYNSFKKYNERTEETISSSTSVLEFPINEGMLILFPGYLWYSFDVNNTPISRVMWIMNILLKRKQVSNPNFEEQTAKLTKVCWDE